jgi:predicted transcriptional regulator
VTTELVERKRYATPRRFLESEVHRMMTSHEDRITRHLISVYKERGDEMDIILSAKRAAQIIGVRCHKTAMKVLRSLVEKQLIKATYEGAIERPNKCSRWRLLMFPYKGAASDHPYLTERERRGIRRNRKPCEVTVFRAPEDVLKRNGWTLQ